MKVILNSLELLEIAKEIFKKHSGEISGEVPVTIHGLELTAEYYFDKYDDDYPQLGISDINCSDEDVFVTFKEEDERMAMSIAELSSLKLQTV